MVIDIVRFVNVLELVIGDVMLGPLNNFGKKEKWYF